MSIGEQWKGKKARVGGGDSHTNKACSSLLGSCPDTHQVRVPGLCDGPYAVAIDI